MNSTVIGSSSRIYGQILGRKLDIDSKAAFDIYRSEYGFTMAPCGDDPLIYPSLGKFEINYI